ncbi:DUF1636 domain-containing protein [Azospirillum picis]|uniref:Metal-binding protein n=1 Tax=Azospirillum picis TaxID=488438 RepID=A0ABU0MI04_9PROT|nr:DUF1636 domain-containing protein [Azospirillum picis]MBP2299270.1 putative metal-binding protein [Azospirillum picis]MDQ0533092.1 putative metal-binding protein [Azospirillum picis]
MPVDVVVCETCRPTAAGEGGDVWTGAMFAALLQGALATSREVGPRPEEGGPTVTTMRCLMNCRRACAVHIRSPGRMGYVLGDLVPDQSAVQALVDYLALYGRSVDGVVPWREWPDGVKGRFVARIPPAP